MEACAAGFGEGAGGLEGDVVEAEVIAFYYGGEEVAEGGGVGGGDVGEDLVGRGLEEGGEVRREIVSLRGLVEDERLIRVRFRKVREV